MSAPYQTKVLTYRKEADPQAFQNEVVAYVIRQRRYNDREAKDRALEGALRKSLRGIMSARTPTSARASVDPVYWRSDPTLAAPNPDVPADVAGCPDWAWGLLQSYLYEALHSSLGHEHYRLAATVPIDDGFALSRAMISRLEPQGLNATAIVEADMKQCKYDDADDINDHLDTLLSLIVKHDRVSTVPYDEVRQRNLVLGSLPPSWAAAVATWETSGKTLEVLLAEIRAFTQSTAYGLVQANQTALVAAANAHHEAFYTGGQTECWTCGGNHLSRFCPNNKSGKMSTSTSSTGNRGYDGSPARGKGRGGRGGYRGSRGRGRGKGDNVAVLAQAVQKVHALHTLLLANEDYSHYDQEDLDDPSEAYDEVPQPPEQSSDPSVPDDDEHHSAQYVALVADDEAAMHHNLQDLPDPQFPFPEKVLRKTDGTMVSPSLQSQTTLADQNSDFPLNFSSEATFGSASQMLVPTDSQPVATGSASVLPPSVQAPQQFGALEPESIEMGSRDSSHGGDLPSLLGGHLGHAEAHLSRTDHSSVPAAPAAPSWQCGVHPAMLLLVCALLIMNCSGLSLAMVTASALVLYPHLVTNFLRLFGRNGVGTSFFTSVTSAFSAGYTVTAV